MLAKNFSKRVAKQVFDTLKEGTDCWNDVRVKVVNEGEMFVNIYVTQEDCMITQPVMQKVLNICDCFETIYGWGTCNCVFEIVDNKPVCNVGVRIKK